MNFRQTQGSARGFTLIELLIVIAVIGILIAMLMPTIGGVRRQARATQCMSHLRQWAGHWTAFLSMHHGHFTEGVEYDGSTVGWRRGEWADSLDEYYMKDTQILLCPEATEPRMVNNKVVDYGGPPNTYIHGAVAGAPIARRRSYGINCWLYNPPPSVKAIQGREAAKHWRSLGAASTPSLVPLMADTMWRGTGPDYDTTKACRPPAVNGDWIDTEQEMMHVAMDRHKGGVNIVFLDGHVAHVPIKRLWRLKWHKKYDRNHVFSFSWPEWMKDLPE